MIGQYVTVHGDVISHVNISHVMVEDGGEYACTAENRAGKTSHSARLNVYGMNSRFSTVDTVFEMAYVCKVLLEMHEDLYDLVVR